MGNVGNVGYKKFCSRPLRCRGPWPPALPSPLQANSNRPPAMQPTTLQCTTLVGGNVSHAYIAYMVRAWGFCHALGCLDVGNVGNVGNVFGEVESLAKRWGRAAKASHIIQPYGYLTPLDIFFKH